jgi:Type II secretion system (T2SS), protein E, N-terminal domain
MSTETKKGSPRSAKAPKGVTPPGGGERSGFLSDVIVELGFASRETVEQAVRAARSPGTTVARVLVDTGALSEEQLARATAERYGIDYIDLEGFEIDAGAANLIKPTAARRYQAVPVSFLGSGLLVAMADPADALGVNDIAVMTKLEVRPAVASRPALDALLKGLPLDELGHERTVEAPPAAGDEQETPDAGEPASPAVFWQDGAGEELPADVAAPADAGETEELRAKLAQTEAELDEARRHVRESKAVGAEVEVLREQLAAAQAGLDQAGASAREAEAASAEIEELRAKAASLKHERDQARSLAKDAERVRERLDAAKAERDEARERARETESELRRTGADAEVRAAELESLRNKLTGAETELVRVRAEVDERSAELEAMSTRAESAEREAEETARRIAESEQEVEEAQRRAAEFERDAVETRRLAEELEVADARAEQARQALAELREEAEREREQAAVAERDLRTRLADEERRRGELEERLSEVEAGAFAAERAFEELRLAQGRMRSALQALAELETQNEDEPSGD